MAAENFVYVYGSGLYVNVTNRCTNKCVFCIRDRAAGVGGSDLWLTREPQAGEINVAVDEAFKEQVFRELVFCGFGEPLLRPDVIIEVCRHVRAGYPEVSIRINTNGLANLVHSPRDIAADLKGLVDVMSISLNAGDAASYIAVSHPAPGLAEKAFDAVISFAREARANGASVIFTVVAGVPGAEIDLAATRRIAADVGATLRIREYQESFD